MSKAARIRELLDAGWSPTQIAQHISCHDAYVRTVRQRIAAGGERPCDREWREHKYATDPKYRRKLFDHINNWKSANREHVRAGQRRRYAAKKSEAQT